VTDETGGRRSSRQRNSRAARGLPGAATSGGDRFSTGNMHRRINFVNTKIHFIDQIGTAPRKVAGAGSIALGRRGNIDKSDLDARAMR
jgi:hypothetical protein